MARRHERFRTIERSRQQQERRKNRAWREWTRDSEYPQDAPTDIDYVESWLDGLRSDKRRLTNPRLKALIVLHDNFGSRIRHEDDKLLVLDKPAGVASHSHDNLPAGALEVVRLHRPQDNILGLHRTDANTSGVLAFAKGEVSAKYIRRQFKGREVKKEYLAFLQGGIEDAVLVDVGIAETTSLRMSIVYPGLMHPDALPATAKDSRTLFTPLIVSENTHTGSPLTYARVEPETGRTHQIRVVAADSLKTPIVGDSLYGTTIEPYVGRFLLHARALTITNPSTGIPMTFEAPVPEDFMEYAAHHAVPMITKNVEPKQ